MAETTFIASKAGNHRRVRVVVRRTRLSDPHQAQLWPDWGIPHLRHQHRTVPHRGGCLPPCTRPRRVGHQRPQSPRRAFPLPFRELLRQRRLAFPRSSAFKRTMGRSAACSLSLKPLPTLKVGPHQANPEYMGGPAGCGAVADQDGRPSSCSATGGQPGRHVVPVADRLGRPSSSLRGLSLAGEGQHASGHYLLAVCGRVCCCWLCPGCGFLVRRRAWMLSGVRPAWGLGLVGRGCGRQGGRSVLAGAGGAGWGLEVGFCEEGSPGPVIAGGALIGAGTVLALKGLGVPVDEAAAKRPPRPPKKRRLRLPLPSARAVATRGGRSVRRHLGLGLPSLWVRHL